MMKLQHYVLFDSDSNPIAAYPVGDADTAVNLGCAIIEYLNTVDRATRDNATIGIESADEDITIRREMIGPDSEWYGGTICQRRGYHMLGPSLRVTGDQMQPNDLCIDCTYSPRACAS